MVSKSKISINGISTNVKMTITEKNITLRELANGYVNNDEDEEGGVFSMNGKLNIRPKYQRSYIHASDNVADIRWRTNLIGSIIHGYPINQFYFGVNEDGTYDEIDGQQRTITICNFIHNVFAVSIDGMRYTFDNLSPNLKNQILDYEIKVNMCVGTEEEKLKWFEIINQPNACLTEQELRNSIYGGEWLESAKKYFSAPTCKVSREITDKGSRYCFKNYVNNCQIDRQEYLETAIDWISYYKYADIMPKDTTRNDRIVRYMSEHQHDADANEMINHYKKVVDWIWNLFLHDKKEGYTVPNSIGGAKWGKIYKDFHDRPEVLSLDPVYCTKRAEELLSFESISKRERVYEFILLGESLENENILQPRSLSPKDLDCLYYQQHGISPIDMKEYSKKELQTHHIKPVSRGGLTNVENCVLITKEQHEKIHNCLYNEEEMRLLKKRLIESFKVNN